MFEQSGHILTHPAALPWLALIIASVLASALQRRHAELARKCLRGALALCLLCVALQAWGAWSDLSNNSDNLLAAQANAYGHAEAPFAARSDATGETTLKVAGMDDLLPLSLVQQLYMAAVAPCGAKLHFNFERVLCSALNIHSKEPWQGSHPTRASPATAPSLA